MRCGEAIRREMVKRDGGRFVAALMSGAAIAFALHSGVGLLLGAPFAVAAFFGITRWQRRSLIKRMGPALAASKGELPPPSREPPFQPNTTGSDYT